MYFFAENTYESCLGCLFGCSSKQTEVTVTGQYGDHLFSIYLTGKLTKLPMDQADIKEPNGKLPLTVPW